MENRKSVMEIKMKNKKVSNIYLFLLELNDGGSFD